MYGGVQIESNWKIKGGKLRVFEVYGKYFKKGWSSGGFSKIFLKKKKKEDFSRGSFSFYC